MVWSLMILLLFVVGCSSSGGGAGGGQAEPPCDPSGTACNCVCPDGYQCGPSTCTASTACTVPDDLGIKYCPDEDDVCYGGECYNGFGVTGVTIHCGLAAITDPTSLVTTPGGVSGGIQASIKSGTLREMAPPCGLNCGTGSSAEGIAVTTLDCDPPATNCFVPLIAVSESASENAPIYGAAPA